jgi:hypothetical protein
VAITWLSKRHKNWVVSPPILHRGNNGEYDSEWFIRYVDWGTYHVPLLMGSFPWVLEAD